MSRLLVGSSSSSNCGGGAASSRAGGAPPTPPPPGRRPPPRVRPPAAEQEPGQPRADVVDRRARRDRAHVLHHGQRVIEDVEALRQGAKRGVAPHVNDYPARTCPR